MNLPPFPERVRVVDSHTEGEPTRVVVDGWPAPAGADMVSRRDDVRSRFDHLRTAVIGEPRGFDAMVGALLTEPVTPGATAGVIFFNNVGYLGMCGHGVIGVVRTLLHLGRVSGGRMTLDTPAGAVDAVLDDDGAVTIRNVVSYCHSRDVSLDVPGAGRVVGDVAWGGNWFFITHVPGIVLEPGNLPALLRLAGAIRGALSAAGITGADGAEIDHIELTAPAPAGIADARNFVLCPGGEYDRSPCGTGTSAKLAVLHARGELAAGTTWRQASVAGGVFDAWFEEAPAGVVPYIRGRAWIIAEGVLHLDPGDPFRAGMSRT
jgi:4-hydroxyproline epimerase